MQYLGGKSRLAPRIAAVLERARGGRTFVEPFCGALNITAAMEPAGPRVASDLNPYLYALYTAVRAGWEPPSVVTEAEYIALRDGPRTVDALTAFVGYACAFGGKWFSGFARHKEKRLYSDTGRRAVLKKMARCREVTFALCSYDRLAVDRSHLVYCDPPYANTTGYAAVSKSGRSVKGFDSAAFWETVRAWVRAGVRVLVSEYQAPPDFTSVWEAPAHEGQLGRGHVEKLFAWAEDRDLLAATCAV